MNPDVSSELVEFGCHPALRGLVDELPAATPCVIRQQDGAEKLYRPLAAGHNRQVAVYVHHGFLSVSLDPNRAKHYLDLTNIPTELVNDTSVRIRIEPAAASDPTRRPALIQAIAEALHRSADLANDHTGHAGVSGKKDYGSCPICRLSLNAHSECDEHGRPS